MSLRGVYYLKGSRISVALPPKSWEWLQKAGDPYPDNRGRNSHSVARTGEMNGRKGKHVGTMAM